jgi:hypothetical protein
MFMFIIRFSLFITCCVFICFNRNIDILIFIAKVERRGFYEI